MDAGRLPARCLWLDGVLSCNYEPDTLPLLFAEEAVFVTYYNTLLTRHEDKKKDLAVVMRLNAAARASLAAYDVKPCLQALAKCLVLRLNLFPETDYQYYAALVHYLLSVICFASHALNNEEHTKALELFSFAQAELNFHSTTLHAADRHLVGCLLNSNWANYWFRRGKVNAATQCCCRAYQLWMRIPGLSVHVVSFLTPFLVTRFGAALVLARKYDEAQRVLTALVRSFPDSQDVQVLGRDRAGEKPPLWSKSFWGSAPRGGEGKEPMRVNVTNLKLLDPEHPDQPTDVCLRSLTVSLPPIPTPTGQTLPLATNWSLLGSAKYVAHYDAALARIGLRRYRAAQEMLERSAVVFNDCFERSQQAGNPHWWAHLQRAYNFVCWMDEDRTADDFRIKFDEHRDRELLYYQKVVQEEITARPRPAGGAPASPPGRSRSLVAADVLARGGEVDAETREDAEAWQRLLPVLKGKAKSDPKVVGKQLKQCEPALDYQSIRNIAGNLGKSQAVRRIKERASEREQLRRTISVSAPPPTAGPEAPAPGSPTPRYVLVRPQPRQDDEVDEGAWLDRRGRDVSMLRKEWKDAQAALSAAQPEGPTQDVSVPPSLARVSPLVSSRSHSTGDPESADDADAPPPDDLVADTLAEYLNEEPIGIDVKHITDSGVTEEELDVHIRNEVAGWLRVALATIDAGMQRGYREHGDLLRTMETRTKSYIELSRRKQRESLSLLGTMDSLPGSRRQSITASENSSREEDGAEARVPIPPAP
eukprot:EG_transcript_3919